MNGDLKPVAEKPEPAKSERTKPVEWVTVLLVAVTLVCGVVKFFAYENAPLAYLTRIQRIEAELIESEQMAIEGEIFSAEATAQVGDEHLPIKPVYVYINNTGKTTIRLKRIEFRVYVGRVQDVTI